MGKKVTITPKNKMQQPDPVDAFVRQAGAEPGAAGQMKRLTIDVTDDLHRRIKTRCAADGAKMADVIRDLLDKHFA